MSDEQPEDLAQPAPESSVLSRRDGPLLILTLNRPVRLNAVSVHMYERLLDEVEVNPLFSYADRAVAVDMRVFLET